MSGILPPSTFGTPAYGPFSDGTVQTYFRESPVHYSPWNGLHSDLQLIKPFPGRDIVIDKLDHLKR
jgi:hypothetical protein